MKIYLLAALVLVALGGAGCSTARIEPRYRAKGAPLMQDAAAPAVFVEVKEADVAPFIYKGAGPAQWGKLTKPFAPFLKETLSQEIVRMGLRLAEVRDQADGVLKVTVGRLLATASAWSVDFIGIKSEVNMSVTVLGRGGATVWSGDFVGNGATETPAPGMPGTAPQTSFNEALGEALDKIRPALELAQVSSRLSGRVPSVVARSAPLAARAELSDIDDLPKAADARRAHAVVIGIERYREKLPTADFAAADARLSAEYFKRVLGVPAENIALLTDDHATNVDFQKYFERWLPNRVKAGDEVYVYFSGHGSPNPTTGDAYLVPYDGDPTYLEQTGYPLKKMYDQLAKLPAKKIVVAMDSCFSGAGGRSVLAKGARPLVTVAAASSLPANITVIAASAGDQISNSYQEKGHGLFTYYLLRGLKEKGPDLKAVYGYLKPEVARVAREQYNADQDPQWREGK